MNNCRGISLLSILMLLLFGSAGIAIAGDGNGLVTVLKGEVNKRSVAGKWKELKEQEKVITGERVRTFEESLAEIIIHKTQKIRLGPETTVDFQSVFEEGEKKVSELDLMEGDLWAEIDKLDEDSSFEVSNKLAHATVRGTVFSLHADSENAVLNVYRGAVEVSGKVKSATSASAGAELSSVVSERYELAAPHEVAGPKEVKGPKEVSLHEWIQVVKAMQQIVVSSDGSWKVRDIDADELQRARWDKWQKALQQH